MHGAVGINWIFDLTRSLQETSMEAACKRILPEAMIRFTFLQMREVVKAVASLFPTAIISGRGREKVMGFVKLQELFYAGSHGMDIVGPVVGCLSLSLL